MPTIRSAEHPRHRDDTGAIGVQRSRRLNRRRHGWAGASRVLQAWTTTAARAWPARAAPSTPSGRQGIYPVPEPL